MSKADTLGKFEILASHRYLLFVDEVGGTPLAGHEQAEMAVKSAKLPTESSDEIEVGVGSERIYYAGKPLFEPIDLVFRDLVDASVFAFLKSWRLKCVDPATGRIGFKSEYAGTARLQLLDPNDSVIREWKLIGLWIQNLDPGQGDDEVSEGLEITATFRYDKAIATIV